MVDVRRPYLSHGDGSLLGEGVVVEVEDAEAAVVLHGFGQRRYTLVIDPILRHVNFLQTAHHLEKATFSFSLSRHTNTAEDQDARGVVCVEGTWKA